EGVGDDEMQAFARWTNLSETTFLLPPTEHGADYRLRIFTPAGELPFAGHPTLGSAHAWLEAGGTPAQADVVVQECAAGLIRIRCGDRLAFAAPPLLRSGPPTPDELAAVLRALRLAEEDVLAASWLVNGPHFMGVQLRDRDAVLAVRPDVSAFGGLDIGVVGLHRAGGEVDLEVRVFVSGMGIGEDPVTGSFNAAVAQWLTGNGTLPRSYVAAQGTALGRRGRVHVQTDADGTIWVGGDTLTTIVGETTL
ncbi:MAG TPA: PhzF family phenazine biosynthesis protein, partial [Nocardioides sp.]|nr:PhzF family phenazine biosynthesis protein [Nocardioides sp.]